MARSIAMRPPRFRNHGLLEVAELLDALQTVSLVPCAEATPGSIECLLRNVDDPVFVEPFGIRFAAASNAAVGPEVEMDDEDALPGLVDVGDREAARAGWLVSAVGGSLAA